jgi:4-amino-4-deoxy-L-arabinose transferase-like glycosyltransferase
MRTAVNGLSPTMDPEMRPSVFEVQRLHWVLLGVLAVAVFIRLGIWMQTDGFALNIVDEQHYHKLAQSLYLDFGFGWGPGRETSIRPPLYPFFIEAVWNLTGSMSLQAVRLAQIVLSICTALLVYVFGRLAFDERVGVIGASLYALYPTLMAYDSLLLTEVLFNFFVMAAAVSYLLLIERGAFWWALALGIVMGLAALTRSAAWPFLLPLAAMLLVVVKRPMLHRIGVVVLLGAGFVATITPWAMRNTELHGRPVMIDTMGGLNMFMGNYEHTPLFRSWAAIGLKGDKYWVYQMWREVPESRRGWNEADRDAWAKGAASRFIKANPTLTLQRSAVKLADFWGFEREILAMFQRGYVSAPGVVVAVITLLSITGWVFMSVGGIVGLCTCARIAPAASAYAFLFAATLAGIHSLVFGHSRYHLPLVPFLCVFAAAALSHRVWRDWRLRRPQWLLASIGMLALFVAWVLTIVGSDVERITKFLSDIL